jgi:hypothetical protein
MEQQLIQTLQNTQSRQQTTREQAEQQLKNFYTSPGFGIALASIASHDSVATDVRLSALINLRLFILTGWSPAFEQYGGQELVSPEDKVKLRQTLLELSMGVPVDRKIEKSASFALSKVALSDYPEEWPDLLPTILHVIQTGNDDQLDGALRVLSDLVDDCLSDDLFFANARDIIQSAYRMAADTTKPLNARALSVKIFKGCVDSMEQVLSSHKKEVSDFAGEVLDTWLPFFTETMRTKLAEFLPYDSDNQQSSRAETAKGLIALKVQVIKTLMSIRLVFPNKLGPQSPNLFSVVWDELSAIQSPYYTMFIANQMDARLVDDDDLPYTLDLLILEELDFIQACLKANAVKKQLQSQDGNWIAEVIKLTVAYAQITSEEEGMWNIDVNVFLSEESSVTANYTPRNASRELAIKLVEWLPTQAVGALLAHTRDLYANEQDWRKKEAALYILNQLPLSDSDDVNAAIRAEAANSVELIRHALEQENAFLRARGYAVGGTLTKASVDEEAPSGVTLGDVALQLMQLTLQAITNNNSELIQVTCVRTLQYYLQSISKSVLVPFQAAIISALSTFIASRDLNDVLEEEDVFSSVLETLRDAIMLDPSVCLNGSGLDDLFKIASHAAGSFLMMSVVTETFDNVVLSVEASGDAQYAQLCERVLPTLTGTFDIAAMTDYNALTNLAAELLNILVENGSEPLPKGFVAATMPKLTRLLLNSDDEELIKSATSAVKNILIHDYTQLFEWHDEQNKGGLENVLVIIDRLLNPTVEDNAAAQVGGLAAELVEKAGPERLGPYLPQLLRAVAVRLATAEQAQFIQSLILVFARLSLQEQTAKEVVDFLASIEVSGTRGLEVVMSKWLENSVNFAGYDEIRQNVLALSKLYNLDDSRLAQIPVKGDLIVDTANSSRIITRSRARAQPDQYTSVSAPLKILKVLIAELQMSSGTGNTAQDAEPTEELEDGAEDDDEWEDDPDTLDLTSKGTTEGKPHSAMALVNANIIARASNMMMANSFAALMNLIDMENERETDSETQQYLVQFFRAAASKDGFQQVFSALTGEEQGKLQSAIQTAV